MMTTQIGDRILIDNIEYAISNRSWLMIPDEFVEKGPYVLQTNNYRGWYANWKLINNKIFLTDVHGCFKKLFKERQFAKWLNVMIEIFIEGNQNIDFSDDLESKVIQLQLIIKNGIVVDRIYVNKKKYEVL